MTYEDEEFNRIERESNSRYVPAKAAQSKWVGLSDRQKLFFVKHAPDLTVLNLIEQVEDELKRNNA